jgi:hypothetical protein
MKGTLEQQALDIYSSDPLGTKEQPPSPNYEDGVDVGYTAPAKWWNWLYNKITVFFSGCLTDRTAMHTELLNVLSSASVTPDSTDLQQLNDSINIKCATECTVYNNKEEAELIDGTSVVHAVNKPNVVGYRLFMPDTELL